MRNFLDRFRPAPAPGPAGTVGLPADRTAGAERELAPLFAALADTERECTRLVEEAQRQAAQRIQGARRTAEALVTDAQQRAVAQRAEAAAHATVGAAAEAGQVLDDARSRADTAQAGAAQRMAELVDQVLVRTRELIEAAGGGG